MFEVDGSQKSGSGTLLRLAVALSAIKAEPLYITNIRASRPQPGLKRQHLEAVLTAAKLCNAKLQGATLGSQELTFIPGEVCGGKVEAVIETAGSIPMLFMAALPICLYAQAPVQIHVQKGGTDTTHAPTINYLRHVLLPTLRQMGVEAEIRVESYGYYPQGMGEATLTVQPNRHLKPILLEKFGVLKGIYGVSVDTCLGDRQVAQRQAKAAANLLTQGGYESDIRAVNDQSNPLQKGSSIVLWAETGSGVRGGADSIGQLRKMAEDVGVEATKNLLCELQARATADIFLADMLIPYMALAEGTSVIYSRTISEHIEANIWLMEKMLNAQFTIQKVNSLYRIEKS